MFPAHPKLTRVRSILCFLFEIKRVLVYDSTILKPTYLFIYTFHSKRIYRQKVLKEKVEKLCLMGQIVAESHSFLKY